MAVKKRKLSRYRVLSKAIKKSGAAQEAKVTIKQLDLSNLKQVESVMESLRKIFPKVDDILTPDDVLGGLGIDIGNIAACPHCKTCDSWKILPIKTV